jgi:hypothetical protein
VGPFSIGCAVEAIYDQFDKETETELVDRYFEATFSPALKVRRKGEVLFFANISCGLVASFEVISSKYKTSKGFSVGSNFAELRRLHLVTTVENREGILYAHVKDLGMLFELDPKAMLKSSMTSSQNLKPGDIDGATRITSVIVY